MELSTEDEQRIKEAFHNKYPWSSGSGFTEYYEGAEYATLYERDKRKLWNDENNNLIKELGRRDGRIQQLEAERVELGNLLAIMHGDGGHHQQKVGTKQAILDAIELLHIKWVTNEMLYDINELRNKVIDECVKRLTEDKLHYVFMEGEDIASRVNELDQAIYSLNSLKTK